jgi:hypothetical protein
MPRTHSLMMLGRKIGRPQEQDGQGSEAQVQLGACQWRAHEGRDCRTAKVQRAAENPPRWPDMNLAAEYKSEAPC